MLGRGLSQFSVLILGIILVRVLSKENFGTYRQVNLVYMTIAGILSFQLDHSLYYFIPKYGKKLYGTILFQTIVSTFIISILISVCMFFSADFLAEKFGNEKLSGLLKIFALYPFIERFLVLIPSFMISTEKAIRAGVYFVLIALSKIVTVVVLAFFGQSLATIFWGIIFSGSILGVLSFIDVFRVTIPSKWQLNASILSEQVHYTWPLLLTTIIGVVSLQFGKIMISLFFTPEDYAVYSCGAFEIPVVALVTVSINSAIMPDLVRCFEKKELGKCLNIWQEAIRKCSLIIFPCFVFFFVIGYDLMVLLYGRDYSMAAWPFRIYLIMLPLRVAVYSSLLRAVGATKAIAIGAFISFTGNIVISLTVMFIGRGTIVAFIGPAIGAVFASFIAMPYYFFRLARTFEIKISNLMRWRELGTILGLNVIAGVIVLFLPINFLPVAVEIVSRGAVYGIILLSLLLGLKILKKDELEILTLPLRKFIKKV